MSAFVFILSDSSMQGGSWECAREREKTYRTVRRQLTPPTYHHNIAALPAHKQRRRGYFMTDKGYGKEGDSAATRYEKECLRDYYRRIDAMDDRQGGTRIWTLHDIEFSLPPPAPG